MALTTIEYGSLASSATLNNNFNYLDGRITTSNNTISSLNTQISTVNTNLSTNKANKDLSNVEDTVLTGKLSSTVLTNAGCLTVANISSASSTTKATIINWVMPDYSSGISFNRGVDYTCPSDGWIYTWQTVDNGNGKIYINGYEYTCIYESGSSLTGQMTCFPVSKNDVVKITITADQLSGVNIFYPCKGV